MSEADTSVSLSEATERRDAVLGIDGALGPFSVALLSRSGIFEPRLLAGRGHDALEAGLRLLGEVLGPVRLSELERIVVSTGPGSFTGLRIAASYAKSLAFAAGVPLVGIDSFDVLEPEEPPASGFSLGVIPSRAGHVNARLRLPGGDYLGWGGTFSEVASRIAEAVPAGEELRVAGAPAGVLASLAERNVHVISVPLPAPVALVVATRGLHRRPLASPHALVADYGEDGPATVAREPR